MESSAHLPVLLNEAVDALAIHPSGTYVDATFGRGGHSLRILEALGPNGRLIAFDRDPQAVQVAQSFTDTRFEMIHAPFSEMKSELHVRGCQQVHGILIDLGVSSPQLDQAHRGFSFRLDGPLDMRMDPTRGEPLSIWIAHASLEELRKVIADYGEERFAVPIAHAIVARCAEASRGEAEPLDTTTRLAELVAQTLRRCGARPEPGQHPATRTFQALRIHLNGELDELHAVLQAAVDLLCEAGRLAVISFHSLEDRVVKQFIRDESGKKPPEIDRSLTRSQRAMLEGLSQHSGQAQRASASVRLRSVSRIRPSTEELRRNPRARSATLRVAEKMSSAQQGLHS
jgi:16S rRNA (cytosine1402-N4)-methyltransferase